MILRALMVRVAVSVLLEYGCRPTVHRVVVLLGDGAGAGELDAGNARLSSGALCHPLGYGRAADVSQADEDDAQGTTGRFPQSRLLSPGSGRKTFKMKLTIEMMMAAEHCSPESIDAATRYQTSRPAMK